MDSSDNGRGERCEEEVERGWGGGGGGVGGGGGGEGVEREEEMCVCMYVFVCASLHARGCQCVSIYVCNNIIWFLALSLLDIMNWIIYYTTYISFISIEKVYWRKQYH